MGSKPLDRDHSKPHTQDHHHQPFSTTTYQPSFPPQASFDAQPGGYHHREGFPTTLPPPVRRAPRMYWPNTRWTWAFMLTAVFQAVIGVALESYVFGKFQANIHFAAIVNSETRSIPTYLAVFMFGYIYQLFLVWDALRLKNTIQVIGLVIYNVGILVYAGIQYDQIRDAADILNHKAFIPVGFWAAVKPMLIALPILMAVATIAFAFEAWKLYDEFAWTIYKRISADTRLKKRYLTYQVEPH